MLFRQRVLHGVPASQDTVTDFCTGWGGETHRLGFLYHTASQFVPEFTHVPRWFQFHSAARGPTGLLLWSLDRPLLTPCNRGSLSTTGLEGGESSDPQLASKAGVSDPEKAAGPGGKLGGQAHGSLPRAWNPGGAGRGERRRLVRNPSRLEKPLKSSDPYFPLKALVPYPTLTSSQRLSKDPWGLRSSSS